MRPGSAALAFGVGLVVVREEVCSVETALEFFNYGYPVPAACVDTLRQQATDWCRDFLSVDVYLSTVTPDKTFFTVTETSTTVTTSSEESTITTDITATSSFTSTIESIVTSTSTTTAAGYIPGRKRNLEVRRPDPTLNCGGLVCIDPARSCIDLTEPNLSRRPAARMSEACSCLSLTPRTVTVDATTADVATSTTTDIVSETSTSTEVSITTLTETSVTVESTSTTATIAASAFCGLGVGAPCEVVGPGYDYHAACCNQGGLVCNIGNGQGLRGTCATCISNGNYCMATGPNANCCSGYCQAGYCVVT